MADNLQIMGMQEKERSLLEKGVGEFNRQEFFECHETLEELWQGYKESDREAIQGIIQIAVGYYHLRRANYPGALKLFERGGGRVEIFGPIWQNLDFALVLQEVNRLKKILSGQETATQVLDNIRFPVIRDMQASKDC